MEVDLFTILPVFYPSILILWIGSLYLRKKSVIISMGLFWGLFILMFIIMFITQIIIAYQSHLELVDEWRYGDPPTFNWYIYIFPLIAIIPLLLIFTIIFKNAIMIYNIKDEDLSLSLNDTLNELNLTLLITLNYFSDQRLLETKLSPSSQWVYCSFLWVSFSQ